MGWKDWPYWIKGGVILIILWIIFNIASSIYVLFFCWDSSLYCNPNVLRLMSFTYFSNRQNNIVVDIIFILFIGVLLGWIYGKIKQSKKDSFESKRIRDNLKELKKERDERFMKNPFGLRKRGIYFWALIKGQSKSKLFMELLSSFIIFIIFSFSDLKVGITAGIISFFVLVYLLNWKTIKSVRLPYK